MGIIDNWEEYVQFFENLLPVEEEFADTRLAIDNDRVEDPGRPEIQMVLKMQSYKDMLTAAYVAGHDDVEARQRLTGWNQANDMSDLLWGMRFYLWYSTVGNQGRLHNEFMPELYVEGMENVGGWSC